MAAEAPGAWGQPRDWGGAGEHERQVLGGPQGEKLCSAGGGRGVQAGVSVWLGCVCGRCLGSGLWGAGQGCSGVSEGLLACCTHPTSYSLLAKCSSPDTVGTGKACTCWVRGASGGQANEYN